MSVFINGVDCADISDRAARLLGVVQSLTQWGGGALTSRDISADLQALTDPAITGLMKSIGDIAALENLITRIGQTSDAIVAAGAVGSLTAKLRRVTQGLEDLKTLVVLAAGAARIGTVSGVCKTVSVTKAAAAAGDYAANDVISESAGAGTVWTWAAIFRANNTGGYITKAKVSCETTGLTHELKLFLYNVAPTCNLNDNVANTGVLNADIVKHVGTISFPALASNGGNSEAIATPSTVGGLKMWVDAAAAADDLIGVLVTVDAITGEVATDDYTITITVEQY